MVYKATIPIKHPKRPPAIPHKILSNVKTHFNRFLEVPTLRKVPMDGNLSNVIKWKDVKIMKILIKITARADTIKGITTVFTA